MTSSLFSIQLLKVVLLFLGAVIACPVQSQTPPQTRAEAAAVLAGELLSMYKGTEITIMDDKTAHLRGFHALDEVIGDDMWGVFVWLDDNCTIRASAAQSWENVAERRLEVRLDFLKADKAYFGPGGTFTVLGNGRDPIAQVPDRRR